MKTIKKQKGFGMIMAILIIVSIVMSLTGYLYQQSSKAYSNFYQDEQSRTELMSNIQDELKNFYIANGNEFSKETLPSHIDEYYIKSNLRLPSTSSSFLKIGISDPKEDNGVRWRNIYAWIPATDGLDNSSFDPSSNFENAFFPGDGVKWVAYSGEDYESTRLSDAVEQLESIADKLQSMSIANVEQDFFHNMDVNYFALCEDRPPYANNLPAISCGPSGGLIDLKDTNIEDVLGLSSSSLTNPWGNEIKIANSSVTNASNQPSAIVLDGEDVYFNSKNIPFSVILVSEPPVENKELHLIVNQIL